MKNLLALIFTLTCFTLHALPDMSQYEHQKITTYAGKKTCLHLEPFGIDHVFTKDVGWHYEGYDELTESFVAFKICKEDQEGCCVVARDDTLSSKNYKMTVRGDCVVVEFFFEKGSVIFYEKEGVVSCFFQTKDLGYENN